jgi:transcriptional regulator with XRE-family HTH domain
MTQDELSRRSGISVGHISELEQGRGNPTHNTILSLAKALDVPHPHILALEAIFERKRNFHRRGR